MGNKTFRGPIILGMCWVAYASIYLGRLNLSIAAPVMEQEALLNAVQIGLLGSCFFFSYAIGQVCNGYIGDLVNPKKMFTIGIIVGAFCNILIGMGVPTSGVFILWSINGYAQSMVWGPLLKVLAYTYEEEKKRARAAMILSTSIGGGSVIAILLASSVVEAGFHAVFWGAGLTMFVVGIMGWFIIPKGQHTQLVKRQRVPFLKIFLEPEVLRIFVPNLAHGIIKDNLNLWIPILFMTMYGIDVKQVVFYVFLIPIATLVGRLIFPWIYHQCAADEKGVAKVSFGACVAALAPLLIWEVPIWLATLLLAVIALAISLINAAFLTLFPLRFVASNNVASVSGIMDFIAYMGAAVGSVIFGILIRYSGYRSIILLWMVLAMVSVGCLIRSKGCSQSIEQEL